MEAQLVFEPVKSEFSSIDELILSQCHSQVPLVEEIGRYLVNSGGKRIRPLIVLLVCKALGYDDKRQFLLATVIEFLHTATLLHDDVVDKSDQRRGRKTANQKWGNAASVLVGDFLYSRAFQMMVGIGDLQVLKILSDITNIIAEGEVLQLANCRNPRIDESVYLKVIESKTAKLFEAASHTGAVLAGATQQQEQALQRYGLHLGLAFQLIDDALDYEGDAAVLGKSIGDDLAEGKPTLPLIHAMEQGTPAERERIQRCIRSGGREDLEEILTIIKRTDALDYTRAEANRQACLAIDYLDTLPPTSYRESLEGLAWLSVNRSS